MATEKRLIDANALIEEIERIYSEHYAQSTYQFIQDFFKAILRRIRREPTVEAVADYLLDNDVVPVVRCKDCRFSARHDIYDPMECMKWTTKWGVAYTTPDGHCHKGERKDNG